MAAASPGNNGMDNRAVDIAKTAPPGFPTEPLIIHVAPDPCPVEAEQLAGARCPGQPRWPSAVNLSPRA